MGETPRRSGFRLPWGDSSDPSSAKPESDDAAEAAATGDSTDAESELEQATTSGVKPGAEVDAEEGAEEGAEPKAEVDADAGASAADKPAAAMPESEEANHFLRELVDAMRGVAESSRDANLGDLRASLDKRVDELRAAAAHRAEELRVRSEQDITAVGEWEQSEIERIRSEAEHRRDARRARLERELTEHQAASDRQVEETRQKLTDYEGQLAKFFAELAEIKDPSVFVTAAKQMPPPPDLASVGAPSGSQNGTSGAAEKASSVDDSLAQRLAQLDKRLAESEPAAADETKAEDEAEEADETKAEDEAEEADETKAEDEAEDEAEEADETKAESPEPAAAVADAPATEAPAATAPAAAQAAGDEASTPIVVKGLGSFGAITSFKQALERVDGVRAVTLSLGPTGEFVYRASHSAEFDIIAAIRSIEGQGAGIEETDGSVMVTIERQR